jgi:hypothetical protein
MASFTITLDDSLVPGILATAVLEEKQPEEVVQDYATAVATKACQDLKVGPYYTGPTPPQFNADGTLYVLPVVETTASTDETGAVEIPGPTGAI